MLVRDGAMRNRLEGNERRANNMGAGFVDGGKTSKDEQASTKSMALCRGVSILDSRILGWDWKRQCRLQIQCDSGTGAADCLTGCDLQARGGKEAEGLK